MKITPYNISKQAYIIGLYRWRIQDKTLATEDIKMCVLMKNQPPFCNHIEIWNYKKENNVKPSWDMVWFLYFWNKWIMQLPWVS